MDSYQHRRILYRLSLSACLLLAGWTSLPASAGRMARVEHSSGQAGEPYSSLQPPARPVAVETLDFADITAGVAHTCGLTLSGGVKCWGAYGGDTGEQSNTPVDVVGLGSGVISVAAGAAHTCAITASGGVKCWGWNINGQLGDGTTTSSSIPVDVIGLDSGVIAVSAGQFHTCALTSDGGVKCWGYNWYGQLGDGTSSDHLTPVDVLGLGSGVTAIAAGGYHTCGLTLSGGIKCWGDNEQGQLGDGTLMNSRTPVDVVGLDSGVAAVDAGESHTCGLTSGSGVKCWGDNEQGQLGDGTNFDHSMPVDVVGLSRWVVEIALGMDHACVVTSGGELKCWGSNAYGQLGDGSMTDRSTPVAVVSLGSWMVIVAAGAYHTCALTSLGKAKCWGNDESGQLSVVPTTGRSVPADVISLDSGVTAVDSGGAHTCALTSGGGVKCWGGNFAGELGDGTTINSSIPVDAVSLDSGVTAVTTGGVRTCALTSSDGVMCWGRNDLGQLGDGTLTDHSTPVDVVGLDSGTIAVVAGGDHTCALTSTGGVKCWGRNGFGQLGNGTTTDSPLPVDVAGLISGVTAIAVGEIHSCALTTTGGVKCWGYNYSGQLGDGTSTDSSTPVDVVGLASGVTSVVAGWEHTCALTSDGGVKCWGSNGSGQLGTGNSWHSYTPEDVAGLSSGVAAVTAGGDHTCALTSGSGLKCWGRNWDFELGDGTRIDRPTPVDVVGLSGGVTSVSAGRYHTCALVGSGRAKCWGSDFQGELGIGTIYHYLTPVDVVESVPPTLTINYPNGQTGSFFTITGWEFPTDTLATLVINNQIITTTLEVNPTGSFILFLDTSSTEAGYYNVIVSADQSASTSFFLADGAPLRLQEGGGQTFMVPAGVAYHNIVYIPLVRR